jgi:hypothetical protein
MIQTELENEDGDKLTVVTTMDSWVSLDGCCRVYAFRETDPEITKRTLPKATMVPIDMPINFVYRGKLVRLNRMERHQVFVRAAFRFLGSDNRLKPNATIRVEECDYAATAENILMEGRRT